MASKNLLVVLAIVAVTLPSVAMAAEIWVGGDKGWTIDFDYQTWAKDKVFNVGDTVVFNYTQGHHNVIKANKTAFDSCTKPPQNDVSSGRDVITLATPGKKWYICGIASHCADHKQKLAITVQVGAPAPTAEPPTNSVSGIVASGYQVLMAAVVALGVVAIV